MNYSNVQAISGVRFVSAAFGFQVAQHIYKYFLPRCFLFSKCRYCPDFNLIKVGNSNFNFALCTFLWICIKEVRKLRSGRKCLITK